jgi:hypothetical protein
MKFYYLLDPFSAPLLIGILGGGVQMGPLGTTATSQPRVIMVMENLVE